MTGARVGELQRRRLTEDEQRQRAIVGPRVIADRLHVARTSSDRRPSIVNRQSRCVAVGFDANDRDVSPSGVTVGEYSLSGVFVTARRVCGRDVVAVDVGLRPPPRTDVNSRRPPSGVKDGWLS